MNPKSTESQQIYAEKVQLSIVIPAYNEEGNLGKICSELFQILPLLKMSWELIIVDDGSEDNTWFEIISLHNQDNRVRGIRLSKNFGHQHALLAGLSHAEGKAIISMDADLQHPPELIPSLIKEWRKGNKIVNTIRLDRRNLSFFKKLTSNMFYKIFSFLSGVKIEKGMADFRLLDRHVLDDILKLPEAGIFLRGIVQWVGYPSSSIEFQCGDRFSGETKYNLRKMLKFAWIGISSFSVIPLRIGIIFGFITSLFAFFQLIEALYSKLFTDKTVPGWTSIIGLIALLFGILFILLGIVGEYIARILEEVRSRPKFIIQETTEVDTSFQIE